ncbi:MAG: hypothetical protein VW600_02800 [Ferrovibrio sp.]
MHRTVDHLAAAGDPDLVGLALGAFRARGTMLGTVLAAVVARALLTTWAFIARTLLTRTFNTLWTVIALRTLVAARLARKRLAGGSPARRRTGFGRAARRLSGRFASRFAGGFTGRTA